MPGALMVQGHLPLVLGSFAKRGVASAMGGFSGLHQIREGKGCAVGWAKGWWVP